MEMVDARGELPFEVIIEGDRNRVISLFFCADQDNYIQSFSDVEESTMAWIGCCHARGSRLPFGSVETPRTIYA